MPITDTAIRATTVTLWDDTLKGFGLRVGKQAKTFIVLIDSGRRHKIDRYPLISLQEARQEARRILAEKTLGRIKPLHTAYEDAKDAYLKECARKNKRSTYRGYAWRFDNHFKFGRKPVADISARDIQNILGKLDDTPMEKRYAFVVARTFFNWCVSQHLIDTSPMARLTVPPLGKSRERVLTDAEFKAIWDACTDDAFGKTVKLLMLTGQRRGEIAHLSLDGDLATIPSQFTKNHRTHTFPVGEMGRVLLGGDLTYGGWGKAKARLDQQAGVTGWTLHDLRRTNATIHAQLGTPPHIIEAILNHKSGIISGVAATYNRFQYLDEMRAAINKFETHLAKVLAE